jgi:hypothetical protein
LSFTRKAASCALALALGAAAGCGRSREDRPSPAPAGVPVRSGDAPRASFRPPPDGLLRKEQLERYLIVLETAAKASRPAEGAGGPGAGPASALVDEDPLVAPDLAAARRTGFPEEEFLWIRERVLEAEASATNARLNAEVTAMLERTLADLRSRRAGAADAGSRQLLDEQIAGFETERTRLRAEASAPEPAAVRGNLKLLEPQRVRIAALQAELDRSSSVLKPQRKGTPAPRP